MSNEAQIQLVDHNGELLGYCDKLAAHQDGGKLHRAVSVLLINSAGEVLIQRRAEQKYHFAGQWANSCCTHPYGDESPIDAAKRAMATELGVTGVDAKEVAQFVYRACDRATGLWEHEYDHLFCGRYDGEPSPDQAEVSAIRWVAPQFLVNELRESPDAYAPWLHEIVRVLEPLGSSFFEPFANSSKS